MTMVIGLGILHIQTKGITIILLYRYSIQSVMMKQSDSGASITIDTIASASGKSRTTVSAVLRGEAQKYRISPETTELIRETAERLGWRPNFFARSLNKKKTHTIGVVFPDVFERFMGETVRGIESALQAADYRMLLSTSRFDWREEIKTIENFQYRGVDGFLIVPCADFIDSQHQNHPVELMQHIGSSPCVVLDRTISGLDPIKEGYGLVVQTDFQGASDAVRYLARQKGAESVGYLGFHLEASSLRHRLAGFRTTCNELGLVSQELLLHCQDSGETDITAALLNMATRGTLPRYWLVSTEGLSYRLASLLKDMGYHLGDNLFIARFGSDIPHFKTGFINIVQPHRAMGTAATMLLLSIINRNTPQKLYQELPLSIETE